MSSLAPTLLLSMPQMLDPNFSRTVVLLCTHSKEGAFGLVVNRPLKTTGQITVNSSAAPVAHNIVRWWASTQSRPRA